MAVETRNERTGQGATMRAALRTRYGGLEALELRRVERPPLVDDGVLVRVRASSVNRGDWYGLMGKPYVARTQLGLRAPKIPLLGTDFAGTVEAVGRDVTGFAPGDEVFGGRSGAYAEYVCVRVGIARKPGRLSFEEAAAVPVAALTALQGLRDKGRLEAGQAVLVNGASGGVGTFAVQIAKALGGEVTAVCSTRNVEQARALGADRVFDYTRDDFTGSGEQYDLIFDNAGSRTWREYRRVLRPGGTFVVVGGPAGNRLLGPLAHTIRMSAAALVDSRKAAFFIAKFNRPDLEVLRELLETGKVRPVVERTYPLSELADALRTMGEGHARGKLVVTI